MFSFFLFLPLSFYPSSPVSLFPFRSVRFLSYFLPEAKVMIPAEATYFRTRLSDLLLRTAWGLGSFPTPLPFPPVDGWERGRRIILPFLSSQFCGMFGLGEKCAARVWVAQHTKGHSKRRPRPSASIVIVPVSQIFSPYGFSAGAIPRYESLPPIPPFGIVCPPSGVTAPARPHAHTQRDRDIRRRGEIEATKEAPMHVRSDGYVTARAAAHMDLSQRIHSVPLTEITITPVCYFATMLTHKRNNEVRAKPIGYLLTWLGLT
ncbi:hypothetical protein B0T26DRAFT_530621 [Lasiosphaeria miniovina]|uniref:Secreted protein n=1 Tax=Lasiosphaeria miniovina TaxID=1954250 RepID=A0AA40DG43_9PEZI|nr:uncharacterized protein B0T26DRAFT_530621 [Lasiosphaeria miniovina]KAK0701795.1 hypothetical protein B0T26DRAFT_530621 [Lasiosphaeria miniovina]